MDRHVDQQRLLVLVMACAAGGACGRVAAEVDRHLVDVAKRRLPDQPCNRAHGGEEAVVLAHHQGHALVSRRSHQLLCGRDVGGKRLLHKHVKAGLDGRPGHGRVPRQRGRHEHRFRMG